MQIVKRVARGYDLLMRTLAFLVLLVAAVGCAKPKPPKIEPHSAQVKSVDASGLTLAVELDVTNPNGFPLLVRTVSGKLLVGSGVEVGTARVDSGKSIPAHGSERLASDLTAQWSNIAALAPLATTGKPVAYTFEGIANVGGESLNMDVPFRLKGELKPEQVIAATLRGLKLPGVSPP